MSFHKARHHDFARGVNDSRVDGDVEIGTDRSNFSVPYEKRAVFNRFARYRNDFSALNRQRVLGVGRAKKGDRKNDRQA